MAEPWKDYLNKIDDYRWEIPVSYKAGMTVPGISLPAKGCWEKLWKTRPWSR